MAISLRGDDLRSPRTSTRATTSSELSEKHEVGLSGRWLLNRHFVICCSPNVAAVRLRPRTSSRGLVDTSKANRPPYETSTGQQHCEDRSCVLSPREIRLYRTKFLSGRRALRGELVSNGMSSATAAASELRANL